MDKSAKRMIPVLRITLGCLVILLVSCREKSPVPKPSCYLRTDLPKHTYKFNVVRNPVVSFSLDFPTMFTISRNISDKQYGFQEIDLGAANGTLLFYSKEFNTRDSLSKLINIANDLVDEHKVKADEIQFEQFINKNERVFGTFFSLKGNVATNFQFYLTDSTKRFIRGELLLNSRPNYDSLRPIIDYLHVDLRHMLSTFKWEK